MEFRRQTVAVCENYLYAGDIIEGFFLFTFSRDNIYIIIIIKIIIALYPQ